MTTNLIKGQSIPLDTTAFDLSCMTIGLGWEFHQQQGGFVKRLLRGPEPEMDLDAMCILLGPDGKVANLGEQLRGSDVVFANNLSHPSGAVLHSGDNLVGGSDGHDAEQITIRLHELGEGFQILKILVTIYEGSKRQQHFGDVASAFIRAEDAQGVEILRYDLSDQPAYAGMRSVMIAEMTREGESWAFTALGEANESDNIAVHLKPYLR